MKRTSLRSLDLAPARKKIAAAKSNKTFIAALLDRDHRGHKEAVGQWTRLHDAAYPNDRREADRATRSHDTAGRPEKSVSIGSGRSQGRFEVADSGIDDWEADRAREAGGRQKRLGLWDHAGHASGAANGCA